MNSQAGSFNVTKKSETVSNYHKRDKIWGGIAMVVGPLAGGAGAGILSYPPNAGGQLLGLITLGLGILTTIKGAFYFGTAIVKERDIRESQNLSKTAPSAVSEISNASTAPPRAQAPLTWSRGTWD